MNKKVLRFVREKVAASAAECVSLNWTQWIVAWWQRISVMNCSLKFPSCSSFALLLCVVPIGFTEVTCGVRCYMWVGPEKDPEVFQQCFYWQPQLWSLGLTKNWRFLPLRVLPMALRCYLDLCCCALSIYTRGREGFRIAHEHCLTFIWEEDRMSFILAE